MKHSLRFSLALMLVALAAHRSNSQLTVTSSNNANALAQKLVGPGVTVSNATLISSGHAAGFFKQVNTNLGIDSGVLLTSGNITWSQGPNNSPSSGVDNYAAGDPQLDALAGTATYNACVLEFDVSNATDTLQLGYVFGSEEYNDFVINLYNDVFAFTISGPGYTTPANIANVPGTSNPVSVGNVNCGTNGLYYVCNDPYDPAGGFCTAQCPLSAIGTTVGYDGFTVPLKAKAVIQACQVYHLRLAVADAVDGIYDSGVFLKAGSLVSGGNCTILPIEIESFDAKPDHDDALLSWVTSSELNSNYFAVERSFDGNQFDEIGKVSAAGQSFSERNYSFIDHHVNKFSEEKIYYRIRLTDLDQSYQYSEVKSIENANSGVAKVFPNPFNKFLTVQFNTGFNEPVTVQLMHVSGKIIFEGHYSDFSSAPTVDGLSSLSNGLYLLRITSGCNVMTEILSKED